MYFGLLFTTFVTWIGFGISVAIVYSIFKNKKSDKLAKYFGILWFFIALVSFFNGLSPVFARRGLVDLAESTYYLKLIIYYISYFPACLFISYKIFKNIKVGVMLMFVYLIGGIFYYVFLIQEKVIFIETTYFSLVYMLNPKTLMVHAISIGILAVFGLYDAIKSAMDYFRSKSDENKKRILYIISLFLVGVYFVPEDLGWLMGWHLALFRTLYVTAAMIGFYSVQYDKDESEAG